MNWAVFATGGAVFHTFASESLASLPNRNPLGMLPDLFDARLTGLLAETGVTDVLLAGGSGCWVSRGRGIEPRPNPFNEATDLERLAIDLIAAGGRQLDTANPFADVVLGDVRVHAVLRSACSAQTQLSLRYLGARSTALADLVALGAMSHDVEVGLREILAKHENFLISGATGSGKTTLLRAMLTEVSSERIITIEDLAELRLGGGAVELVARHANLEGRGEVTLQRLLVEALRMRPDRLVVGELRGGELLVLLQAMNTGHSGSGATLHANAIESVPARLRALGLAAGLGVEVLESLVAASVQWVIHVGNSGGRRAIEAIGRFELVDGRLTIARVL